jgi:hypothetical protein
MFAAPPSSCSFAVAALDKQRKRPFSLCPIGCSIWRPRSEFAQEAAAHEHCPNGSDGILWSTARTCAGGRGRSDAVRADYGHPRFGIDEIVMEAPYGDGSS